MDYAAERPVSQINLRARLDGLIERPMPLFIALFIIFVAVYGASIFILPHRYGRLINGDGIYYYVYVRSAVVDGDLDFNNDYTLYQQFNNEDPLKKQEMLTRKTPTGMASNYFSVGPAVLWSPIFLMTRGLETLFGHVTDGFDYIDQAPVLILSIVYGFIGILLTYRVVAGMFSRFAAFVSVLGIWLATNVVYYMGVSPSASHVLSMFACALFVYLWWRKKDGERTRLDWLVWGLSAGLMALVRWQDSLIALLALFEWVKTTADGRRQTDAAARSSFVNRLPSSVLSGILFLVGALLAFIPQMVAWQILYGSPLTIPQGSGFLGYFMPEILNVWFSTKRGLFSWTPIILLAVIGFIPLYRKNRVLGASAIIIFLLETYFNSIVVDWWGGEAFGARRFISLMPFFALGLAALVDALPRRVLECDFSANGRRKFSTPQTAILVALVAFALWNNLFILQYNLWLHGIGHISAIPTLQEMTIDKFTAPFKALASLRKK